MHNAQRRKTTGRIDIVASLALVKACDMVAVQSERANMAPMFDPISHLVYAASRAELTRVWANGLVRFANSKFADRTQNVISDS